MNSQMQHLSLPVIYVEIVCCSRFCSPRTGFEEMNWNSKKSFGRRTILQLNSQSPEVKRSRRANALCLIGEYEDDADSSKSNQKTLKVEDQIDSELANFLAEINAIDEKPLSENEEPDVASMAEAPTTNWQQCLDEGTQCYYFWNVETNEVTWEIPEEYSQYLLNFQEYDEKLAAIQQKQEKSNKSVEKVCSSIIEDPSQIDLQIQNVQTTVPSAFDQILDDFDISHQPMMQVTDIEVKCDMIPDSSTKSSDLNVPKEQNDNSEDGASNCRRTRIHVPFKDPMSLQHNRGRVGFGGKIEDNTDDNEILQHNTERLWFNEPSVKKPKIELPIIKDSSYTMKFVKGPSLDEEKANISHSDDDIYKQRHVDQQELLKKISGGSTFIKSNKNFARMALKTDKLIFGPSLPDPAEKSHDGSLSDFEHPPSQDVNTCVDHILQEIDSPSPSLSLDASSVKSFNAGKEEEKITDSMNSFPSLEESRLSSLYTSDQIPSETVSEVVEEDGSEEKFEKTKKDNGSDKISCMVLVPADEENNVLSDEKFLDVDDDTAKELIQDISSILASKFEFLDVTRKGMSKLQILFVELQTRLSDWMDGVLTTQYFFRKLQEANSQVEQYESGAAPKGWTCHWDRDYKRYFYTNDDTSESQWEYPSQEDNFECSKDISQNGDLIAEGSLIKTADQMVNSLLVLEQEPPPIPVDAPSSPPLPPEPEEPFIPPPPEEPPPPPSKPNCSSSVEIDPDGEDDPQQPAHMQNMAVPETSVTSAYSSATTLSQMMAMMPLPPVMPSSLPPMPMPPMFMQSSESSFVPPPIPNSGQPFTPPLPPPPRDPPPPGTEGDILLPQMELRQEPQDIDMDIDSDTDENMPLVDSTVNQNNNPCRILYEQISPSVYLKPAHLSAEPVIFKGPTSCESPRDNVNLSSADNFVTLINTMTEVSVDPSVNLPVPTPHDISQPDVVSMPKKKKVPTATLR